MSEPFRWATTSARLLAGTVVIVGFAVGVTTAVSVTWPQRTHQAVSVPAAPTPEPSVLVCAGPVLAIARDASDASALTPVADQTLTSASSDLDAEPTEMVLSAPGGADSAGPVALSVQPRGRERGDLAATGSAQAQLPDLAGYAAAPCRAPLAESWLVGGSGETGAADLVLLSNPGKVTATVTLTVYGAEGAQVPPGGAAVAVAAGSQRVVPLAGLLLGEGNPVLRVSATGAPITATLQTSITRTLVPGGIDQVVASAEPDLSQSIVGVTVADSDDSSTNSTPLTVLRVLSPLADTTANITITPVGGPAVTAEPVPLTAEVPTEIDLGALKAGSYVVRVDAAEPIVAAVWHATGITEGSDFVWFPSTPMLTGSTLFATPAGPDPNLTVSNTSEQEITVSVSTVSGSATSELTIPAGGSDTLRLSPNTVYALEPRAVGIRGAPGFRAGVSLSGPGQLAGFAVWPSPGVANTIQVYP